MEAADRSTASLNSWHKHSDSETVGPTSIESDPSTSSVIVFPVSVFTKICIPSAAPPERFDETGDHASRSRSAAAPRPPQPFCRRATPAGAVLPPRHTRRSRSAAAPHPPQPLCAPREGSQM